MNVEICATFPPTYKSLFESVQTSVMELFNPANYTFPPTPFPPFSLNIPPLSTLPPFPPTIAAPSFGSPTLRVEQFINELSTKGILLFFDALITAIKDISGIEVPTPTVWGIKLSDFFTKTFDELAAMYTGPTIGSISASFSSHLSDVRRSIQALAGGEYLRVLFNSLTSVLSAIKAILDPLNLVPLPTLPTVPTRDEVIAMLYAMIAPRTTLTYDDLFNFSLAGFSLDMGALLPEKISPYSQVGTYDLEQGIKLLMSQLVVLPLLTVLEFLALIGISITFAPFCLVMVVLPV